MVEVYANWSRWVADCGWCRYGARQLQPRIPHFECWTCGAVTDAVWPSERMVQGVERLLMMRPDPSTRNWVPGETLPQLMWENGDHGIFDNVDRLGVEMVPGQSLFAVDDGGIRVDNLPALKPRIRQEISS